MRRFVLAVLALLALSSTSAFALTTDSTRGMNSDGTAKYTDPDDQQPSLLNGPAPKEPSKIKDNKGFHFSVTHDGDANNPFSQQQSDKDAFDRAYDHK